MNKIEIINMNKKINLIFNIAAIVFLLTIDYKS
jgi:hypothetical protein